MRTLLSFAVALAFAGSVSAQDGLPVAATVRIEKIESKQADHERRIAELERQLATAKLGVPPPAAVPTAAQRVGVVSWRNPVGHTHTCPNCGDTWDHSKNPGHVCQQCGTEQRVQDAYPRAVQVRTAFPFVPPTGVQTETRAVTTTYTVVPTGQPYTLAGGCPNGQCDSGGFRNRRGLFGWRNW